MKKKYFIELCGCDDTTPFVMELDENEVNLLQAVAQKSREVSSYACMPRMFIKPLDECDDYDKWCLSFDATRANIYNIKM